MGRVPFDRSDEVRYEIGAAFVLVEHLRPRRIDLLIQTNRLVMIPHRHGDQECYEKQNAAEYIFYRIGTFHVHPCNNMAYHSKMRISQ